MHAWIYFLLVLQLPLLNPSLSCSDFKTRLLELTAVGVWPTFKNKGQEAFYAIQLKLNVDSVMKEKVVGQAGFHKALT